MGPADPQRIAMNYSWLQLIAKVGLDEKLPIAFTYSWLHLTTSMAVNCSWVACHGAIAAEKGAPTTFE